MVRCVREAQGPDLGDLYTESGQTLEGSFSTVSTPIFATKYSLESSSRDLHNTLLCTALQSHFFCEKIAKILLTFVNVLLIFVKILLDFDKISAEFHRNFTGICQIANLPEKYQTVSERPTANGRQREADS